MPVWNVYKTFNKFYPLKTSLWHNLQSSQVLKARLYFLAMELLGIVIIVIIPSWEVSVKDFGSGRSHEEWAPRCAWKLSSWELRCIGQIGSRCLLFAMARNFGIYPYRAHFCSRIWPRHCFNIPSWYRLIFAMSPANFKNLSGPWVVA